jgi:membrane-associated phospholipid phosphatase
MKTTAVAGIALVMLTLLAIVAIDEPVARAVSGSSMRAFVDGPMTAIEYAFGFPVSKWLTGAVLLVAAIVLFFVASQRQIAWLLLFVSLSQLSTRLIAGVLKNVFLRSRPFQGAESQWFVENGSSFPSGHAAHFWGLFFALALAFPRTRIPALVLALFVSLSRVVVNDHWVSDVTGSAAIAALVTVGWAVVFRRRLSRLQTAPPTSAPPA